jgi:hypothetical protein
MTKSPVNAKAELGNDRFASLPFSANDFPPHLLCAVDCVEPPTAVMVLAYGEESTNAEPVPSAWSKRTTLE